MTDENPGGRIFLQSFSSTKRRLAIALMRLMALRHIEEGYGMALK